MAKTRETIKLTNARPIGARVIVRRDAKERTSPGGIVLPEVSIKDRTTGTVVAVGRGTLTIGGTFVPLEAKTGDRVTFHAHSGYEIAADGESLVVLNENDILAIL